MKEKEYKEALEAFNGKNREKAQLVNRLIEVGAPNSKHFGFEFWLTDWLDVVLAVGQREREVEDEEAGGAEQEHWRNRVIVVHDTNWV